MSRVQWRGPLRRFLWVAAFCGVIALLIVAIWPRRTYMTQFGVALIIGTTCWIVIEFGRHLVNESGYNGWPRGWRGRMLVLAGIVGGALFGSMLANALFGNGGTSTSRDSAISWLITAIAGAAITFFFHARSKQSELAAQISAAERDAAEARLKLIATQLEPHMLFNTLANLRVLIPLDPPRAVAMLDLLDSYLRVTLTGSRALAHPLAAEFSRLHDYLELMTVRMGARLRYALELPADLREVPIPPLLLQPLVENSIRHGLEPQVEGGEVTVRARRDGERVIIEVADTGLGIDTGAAAGGAQSGTSDSAGSTTGGNVPPDRAGGFGLAQLRERLATVYGDRAAMTLAAVPAGGTCATITFPLKT